MAVTPRLSVCLAVSYPTCELAQEPASQVSAHADATPRLWLDAGGLHLHLPSLFITSSVLNAFSVIYTKVGLFPRRGGGGSAAISDITVLTFDLLLL